MQKETFQQKQLDDLTKQAYQLYKDDEPEELAFIFYNAGQLHIPLLFSMKNTLGVTNQFIKQLDKEMKRLKDDEIQVEKDRKKESQ